MPAAPNPTPVSSTDSKTPKLGSTTAQSLGEPTLTYVYRDADGTFAARFPQAPEIETVEEPLSATASMKRRSAYPIRDDGMWYAASVLLRGAVGHTCNTVLTQLTVNAVEKSGCTILAQRPWSKAGIDGLDADFSCSKTTMKGTCRMGCKQVPSLAGNFELVHAMVGFSRTHYAESRIQDFLLGVQTPAP